MIINYKLYTESLNYNYPYERIIILINGIVDYHSVFDFIENEFDIEINKIRSDETLINTNLIHIALSVPNLYNALNGLFRSIDETDILRFYSTEFNNIDSMLEVINDTMGSYYYNEKDILTLKDLKSIKQLLLYGRKNNFYQMYNKPKENIYESILSKLKGPNEKEVWKNFGYEKGFDTPEEFFLDVIKDIKVKEQSKYPQTVSWEKNGKIIFEQDFKSNMLYVDYDSIWLVFRKIFGLHYTEIYSFVGSMVEEHLNWKGFTLAGVDLSSFTITKEHLNWNKKYKIFKESLLSKLDGPTKDEIFKSFGYEKGFDTPEEFFLDVIKDIKVKEQTKYTNSIFWEKNGKIIFEQDSKRNKLYVDYDSIYVIFQKVFGLQDTEIPRIIKRVVEKNLNWKGLTHQKIEAMINNKWWESI